jgi:hypothetical protein
MLTLYFNPYDIKHQCLCVAVCQNFQDFNQIVLQLDLSINFFLCKYDNFSYKLLSYGERYKPQKEKYSSASA